MDSCLVGLVYCVYVHEIYFSTIYTVKLTVCCNAVVLRVTLASWTLEGDVGRICNHYPISCETN